MLSVSDMKEVRFRRSNLGGYKTEDVDQFVDDAKRTYNKICGDNLELINKIKFLAQKINEYRENEECVKNTLIKAEKLADLSIIEARERAEEIINDAIERSEVILSDSKDEIKRQQGVLDQLKNSAESFREQILALYGEHIESINKIVEPEEVEGFYEIVEEFVDEYKEADELMEEFEGEQGPESELDQEEKDSEKQVDKPRPAKPKPKTAGSRSKKSAAQSTSKAAGAAKSKVAGGRNAGKKLDLSFMD